MADEQLSLDSIVVSRPSPTIMRLRWTGHLTLPDYERMIAHAKDIRAELGEGAQLHVLVIVGTDAKLHPQVRRASVELGRQRMFGRTAVVDAPRRIRVLIELLVNAIRVLAQDESRTRFFDSEAEARAWLESA